MCRPIGGYYSLELSKSEEFHKDAIKLNTGRNCLEYILRARGYKKVYIPYYTCEVILEPFHKTNTAYEFYHINLDLELAEAINLRQGEVILYTNYFGLKQSYVEFLAEKYNQQIIVDNTQAFYAKPVLGIDTFYTCRKFFGVPDGAYLYTDKVLECEFKQDVSWDRMTFLTKRIDEGAEAGYEDFQEKSKSLIGQPIKRMSRLTESLMQSIDYEAVKKKRRTNYAYLYDALYHHNKLRLELPADAVPMVYPYMDSAGRKLRELLIKNKIFVARYWPNVRGFEDYRIEEDFANKLLPLPCDQRYGNADMAVIVECINS